MREQRQRGIEAPFASKLQLRSVVPWPPERGLEQVRKHGAAPRGCKSANEAADGVEGSESESTGADGGKRLPLVSGEGGIRANESDGNQITPGRAQIGTLAKIGDHKTDGNARREVDDEGAVGEFGANAPRDSGANPVAGNGAKAAAGGD